MTLMFMMTLATAQAGVEVYLGSGLSGTWVDGHPRFSLMLESEVRELMYTPLTDRRDVGVVRTFTAADYGGFAQLRLGEHTSFALGGLTGVTHVEHELTRSHGRATDSTHDASFQAAAEFGVSFGPASPGLHLGGAVAGASPGRLPALFGARSRTVWAPHASTPLEVDLLVRGNVPDIEVCLALCGGLF